MFKRKWTAQDWVNNIQIGEVLMFVLLGYLAYQSDDWTDIIFPLFIMLFIVSWSGFFGHMILPKKWHNLIFPILGFAGLSIICLNLMF